MAEVLGGSEKMGVRGVCDQQCNTPLHTMRRGSKVQGELLHSHFDKIPATLFGITHKMTAGTVGGGDLRRDAETRRSAKVVH